MSGFAFFAALALVLAAFSSNLCAQNEQELKVIDIKQTPNRLIEYDNIFYINEASQFIMPNDKFITHYNGLYSVIINKALNYHHRLWNQATVNFYDHSQFNPNEFQKQIENYDNWDADLKFGKWNDRSFAESLIQEKGGAKPISYYEFGQDIELLRFGFLTFNNTGKIGIGDASFYFNNKMKLENKFIISNNGIFKQDNINFSKIVISFKPKFIIKPVSDINHIISNMSIEAQCKINDNADKSWAFISFKLNSEPAKQKIQFVVNASFSFW